MFSNCYGCFEKEFAWNYFEKFVALGMNESKKMNLKEENEKVEKNTYLLKSIGERSKGIYINCVLWSFLDLDSELKVGR